MFNGEVIESGTSTSGKSSQWSGACFPFSVFVTLRHRPSGWTLSSDFPTSAGAFDPTHNGDYDAFLLILGPAGGSILYRTFLGTPLPDYGRSIGADAAGSAYLAGYTGFENVDAFGLKLDLIALGAR